MAEKTIKIDAKLFSILENESINNFTILELRDAIYSLVKTESKEIIRMNIYRQIQPLVKQGLLVKNGHKHSKNITYQKTAKFYESQFLLSKSDTIAYANRLIPQNQIIDELKQRLEASEVALFCSMGESEEYQVLSETYPELKKQLTSRYKSSQKQMSKLQGQIKALQNLIFRNSIFSEPSSEPAL